MNFYRILNCKAVKSHLPLPAKKFNTYIYHTNMDLPLDRVFSSHPLYKDGDLLACDCKDKFSKFVYKPHGHVHTGDLELIENIPCKKNKLTYLYRYAIEQLTKKVACSTKRKIIFSILGNIAFPRDRYIRY